MFCAAELYIAFGGQPHVNSGLSALTGVRVRPEFAGLRARRGLAAVLGSSGSKGVLDEIRTILKAGEIEGEARNALALALVAWASMEYQ